MIRLYGDTVVRFESATSQFVLVSVGHGFVTFSSFFFPRAIGETTVPGRLFQ